MVSALYLAALGSVSNLVQLVYEWLEVFYLALYFLLGGAGPGLGLGAKLLKPMAEDALFLPIERKALNIAILINLIDYALHVVLDVIDHLLDLFQCLLDLPLLNLANLNCIDAFLLYGLQMDISYLLDIWDQLAVVIT